MDNVIQFPDRKVAGPLSEDITTTDVLHGLRQLWLVGEIQQLTYAIGCQALYFLAQAKKNFVPMTWSEMTTRHVTYNEKILAGPVKGKDWSYYPTALLELHECTGLLNTLDKKFFNENGNVRQHFTMPHPMRRDWELENSTRVYFRLDKMTRESYLMWISGTVEGVAVSTSRLAVSAA